MEDYTTADIIDLCLDGNPTAIQNAVDHIMLARVAEFLDAKKVEVAQRIFNPEQADNSEEESDA
jgi:hypothetical protein